jgi:hypothetical protein
MTGLFVPDDILETITDESDHRSCSAALQETPRRRARSNVARRNPLFLKAFVNRFRHPVQFLNFSSLISGADIDPTFKAGLCAAHTSDPGVAACGTLGPGFSLASLGCPKVQRRENGILGCRKAKGPAATGPRIRMG